MSDAPPETGPIYTAPPPVDAPQPGPGEVYSPGSADGANGGVGDGGGDGG
ncbi:hypothetical protein Sfulv_55270 [Streptomyces fulvorobeus]|uniref:Uncharacterized protein n=1 Tax=Streptomyces fulvorobeus TaxID=284028 RepID=A0A7J0CG73_9ACTN|nr:hypothetical protein Sfulv_55270 [Streptomyces fulvorobeus]